MKQLNIDWTNHTLSFLSALLGIFIAFRLESYRESKSDSDKAEAMQIGIKSEIENNMRVFEGNINLTADWIAYYEFCAANDNKDNNLVLGDRAMINAKAKYPKRFDNLEIISSLSDTVKIYRYNILIDILPMDGVSTSNWNAAHASGLLNTLDFKLIADLSKIYEWTNKDIGLSDKVFYQNMLGLTSTGFGDSRALTDYYYTLNKTSSFKLDRIKNTYSQVDWSK
jgi:hypothetical protein